MNLNQLNTELSQMFPNQKFQIINNDVIFEDNFDVSSQQILDLSKKFGDFWVGASMHAEITFRFP